MKKTSIKGEDYQKYYKQLILKKIGVIGQKKIFNSKVLEPKKKIRINPKYDIIKKQIFLKKKLSNK